MSEITGPWWPSKSRVFGSKQMQEYYDFEYPKLAHWYRPQRPIPAEQYEDHEFTLRSGIAGLPGWESDIKVSASTWTVTCTVRGPPPEHPAGHKRLRQLVKRVWFPGILLELDVGCTRGDPDYSHNLQRYRDITGPDGLWTLQANKDETVLEAKGRFQRQIFITAPDTELQLHQKGSDCCRLDYLVRYLPPIIAPQLTMHVPGHDPMPLEQYISYGHESDFYPRGTYNRRRARPFRCRIPTALQPLLEQNIRS